MDRCVPEPNRKALLTDEPMNSVMDGNASVEEDHNSHQVDPALQSTLKRVSREIQLRKTGWKDCKQPLPPMYERVGNSVAYQLLLQFHPSVTVKLINSFYPALKELEESTEWLYEDYIEAFNEALKKKATPCCLHPAETPTVKFLADLCVHVCALPPDSQLHRPLVPTPELWMQVLAIFSKSPSNQGVLVEHRCPSKVVGCMNLTSMADNTLLQCAGWEVLTNVVSCPPSKGSQPAVHIQAITLLLSHIKCQLDKYCYDQQLISAILHFLAALATTARTCATSSSSSSTETLPQPYNQGSARDILQLMEERGVKQLLLELPEHLLEEETGKADLQAILLAMAPLPEEVKAQSKPVPPPKPRRARCRTQINLTPDINLSPHLMRKHPELPTKRISKSSEDLLDSDLPRSTHDPELSLPLSFSHKKPIPSSHRNPFTQSTILTAQKPSSSPRHQQKEQSRHSIAVPSGPQQLSHYNRVSTKRKARGSYIRAVTTSKQKPGEKPETPVQSNNEVKRRETVPSRSSDIPQHTQVVQTLTERKELLADVAKLWRMDKSLQAASNAVCTCFFTGSPDFALFVDCIDCFTSTPSHWTLGVCIVLLPYLRQIVINRREGRCLEVVNTVVALVVKRFSSAVLTSKRGILSSRADAEQRLACYHELHLLHSTCTSILRAELPPASHVLVERMLLSLRPFANSL